jgi:phosphotransferase family enzyme
VARAHGLDVREPRVLSDCSNLLVRLSPDSVVARVATSTGAVRAGAARDWLARDVAVASFLAERGGAVVPPASELPPGPHVEAGLAITFWRFVEHDPSHPPGAREAGEALRRLHEALEDYPGELPPFTTVLDECARLIDRVQQSGSNAAASLPAAAAQPGALDRMRAALDRIRSETAAAELPPRSLHGDASPSNLLRTPAGLLWTDFEDTCAGSVEWDLACLALSAEPDAAAALAGYGRAPPDETVEPFLEARRLQAALWTTLLAESHPELRARAEARMSRWVEAR